MRVTGVNHVRARRQLPKTGRTMAHVVAKTRPEDTSGKDTCHREDTWAREDASPRQVWRRRASSRRHVGGRRHFPKTGRAKTRVVAKTHGRAKTLPEDRSGEDTHHHKDTWAGEDTSQRQVWRRPKSPRRHRRAKTRRANTPIVAKTRGRHIESRQPQPREAVCFELQGHSFCCSKLYASTCQGLFAMAQLHDLIFLRCVHTRPRLSSPPPTRVRACANPACPQWRRKRVVANPALAWHRPMQVVSRRGAARSASGRQLALPDVASKCGVICLRGVKEPGSVAGAVPGFTPLIGLTCRWRQNVASLVHVASGSHVASS